MNIQNSGGGSPIKPPKSPSYNVGAIQSTPRTTSLPGYNSQVQRTGLLPQRVEDLLPKDLLGFAGSVKGGPNSSVSSDPFQIAKQNEALAAKQGLKTVYNAPFKGESGVSGWGTDAFGEAYTRAGSSASRVNVAYVPEGSYGAARQAAIASEQARGNSVVGDAYRYTRFSPGEAQWRAFGSAPPVPSRSLLAAAQRMLPAPLGGGNFTSVTGPLGWLAAAYLAKLPPMSGISNQRTSRFGTSPGWGGG